MEKDNLNWKMKIINPINTKFCLVLFTIISSFQYSFGQGGIPNLPESLKTIPFGTEIKELKPNKIHEKISVLAYLDILEVNTLSEKERGLNNWHVIFLSLFFLISLVIIFYFIRKWKQKKGVTPFEKNKFYIPVLILILKKSIPNSRARLPKGKLKLSIWSKRVLPIVKLQLNYL
jgi:hypothetical protein